MSKSKPTLAAALDSIFEEGQFDTLKTAELEGKTFIINALPRSHTSQHGTSWIAEIEIDGEPREAWLSGSRISQQIAVILEDEDSLPVKVTLVREASIPGEPFRLLAL